MIYSLEEPIQGENLKKLIRYLLECTSYFSLTMHDASESEIHSIKKNAHFLKEIFAFKWFSYITLEKPLHVMLFRSDMQMLDFILEYFPDGLFGLTEMGVEDICFFDEKGIVLGSVTHADIAHLFVDTEQMQFFDAIGKWKQIFYTARDYEFVPSI